MPSTKRLSLEFHSCTMPRFSANCSFFILGYNPPIYQTPKGVHLLNVELLGSITHFLRLWTSYKCFPKFIQTDNESLVYKRSTFYCNPVNAVCDSEYSKSLKTCILALPVLRLVLVNLSSSLDLQPCWQQSSDSRHYLYIASSAVCRSRTFIRSSLWDGINLWLIHLQLC